MTEDVTDVPCPGWLELTRNGPEGQPRTMRLVCILPALHGTKHTGLLLPDLAERGGVILAAVNWGGV